MTAFHWGRKLAHDPGLVGKLTRAKRTHRALCDMSLDEVIKHRSAHLAAWQNQTLAARYRALVARARERADALGLGDSLPRAVATTYARVLAYKDEYEVARLLSEKASQDELSRHFEGDFRIRFNLAPPFLRGTAPDGRPKKREFGPWFIWVLRALTRAKSLRGTLCDPFARTPERRMDRALVSEYEELIPRLLTQATPQNADIIAKIVALYDDVRGFGPVKEEAIAHMHQNQTRLLAELEREPRDSPEQSAA